MEGNPRLNQAKSRYTKDIEGLLAQNEGIEGTSTFWMSDAYSAADMAITEEAVVTATQFEIQTDKSRGEIIWTGTYSLDEPSIVTANVYLDDKLIYDLTGVPVVGSLLETDYLFLERGRRIYKIRASAVIIPSGDGESIETESGDSLLTEGGDEILLDTGDEKRNAALTESGEQMLTESNEVITIN